jgi:single-strand DNA-binding protein
MALATIGGRGFIIGEIEFKFTPSGTAVANFPVAFNKDKFDQDKDKWVRDKEAVIRFTAWGDLAEFINEKFEAKTEIDIQGDFHIRKYEDKEGNERQSIEATVRTVGAPIPKRDKFGSGKGSDPSDSWGSAPSSDGY